MAELICALGGMALGAGLLALGWLLGRREKSRPEQNRPGGNGPAEQAAGDRALERLEADQRAFSALMGYSADVAYGLTRVTLEE